MKRTVLFFFVFMMFITSLLVAQSQRMVLAEEFTSATCGPCAGQNPAFDALLQQNADKITSIKYHMSWPAPGNDPMYLHNTADNNARRAYYGINSVPHVQIDGNWWDGMPSQVSQSLINVAAAIPSPCEIQVQHQLSADGDSIYVTALINATDNFSGDLRAFLVVIEKHIHFNSPPGTNGERDFYNVMKKMLPSNSGMALNSTINSGEYFIVQSSWELANVYNNDELAVVVFIQDYDTKEVFQAANSSTNAITPLYSNDVEVSTLHYAMQKNCSSTMKPLAVIRNNGANNITSMVIKYKVNDGDEMTYNWTGNMGFLDTVQIQFPEISFTLQDTNELVVDVVSINGGSDDYTANNTYYHDFYRADVVEDAYLVMILDDHPEQTTWKLIKYTGEVVQEGGPYSDPGGNVVVPLEFTTSDCYRFEMYDSGNDGLTGYGFYQVVLADNTTLFSGGDFTDRDENEITFDIVGVHEQNIISNFTTFPNPVHNNLNIRFNLADNSTVDVEIYDMLGKKMISKQIGNQPAGVVETSVEFGNLNQGVYFVKVIAGTASYMQKIMVK